MTPILAPAAGHRLVPRARHEAAFTLVEVAVAVAVLIVSVLAGTDLMVLASRHSSATEGRVAERDAALELLWSLERLPYLAEPGADSLIRQVFPHAVSARNSNDAFYVAQQTMDLPAGCFVTNRSAAGRDLLVVARFLGRDAQGEWQAAGDGVLHGHDFAIDQPPPVVQVAVCRASGGRVVMITGRVYTADAPVEADEP